MKKSAKNNKSQQTGNLKLFDVIDVDLSGTNLIEASAGTGKTYSLAILAVRLIIEKGLSVKEILMVTFTKAAVAELEERIRKFIKVAYIIVTENHENDPTITKIIENAVKNIGKEIVIQRLHEAIMNLDESSVQTIHSFCQVVLNELAFETDQNYECEALENDLDVIEEEVNKCWRAYVTNIDEKLLEQIINSISREQIIDICSKVTSGKIFLTTDEQIEEILINAKTQEKCIEILNKANDNIEKIKNVFFDYLLKNKNEITQKINSNKNAKKALETAIDNPTLFLEIFAGKSNTDYVARLFPELLNIYNQIEESITVLENNKSVIISSIYSQCISKCTMAINRNKKENNLLSFDDMISNLHDAVNGPNQNAIKTILEKKYKAVFVDEFQDTDKLQYEIFNTIFSEKSILFFIGDPKQSIYSFRKADIFTYLKASGNTDNIFSMNVNFRSSERYINAMNHFFLPEPSFDTFLFSDSKYKIDYHQINSPSKTSKGELYQKKKPADPITIIKQNNTELIIQDLANNVSSLLQSPDFKIVNGKGSRKITPSDIGVLVRTNRQGQKIKAALALRGIYAITIDEVKLLQTNEATEILYVLQAIQTNTKSNIFKALLTEFTGYTRKEIIKLKDENLTRQFNSYKLKWENECVYPALQQFFADYRLRFRLMNLPSGGDRILSNILQITELLHNTQQIKKYTPQELIQWLDKNIQNASIKKQEYAQRIESDEDAVRIVTIHKSKGLEYNIVFAPHLDMISENKSDMCSFRNEQEEEYYYGFVRDMKSEHWQMQTKQQMQEFRRLIYVAVTRAVFKCYIYKSTNGKYKESALAPFIESIENNPSDLINFDLPCQSNQIGNEKTEWYPFLPLEIKNLKIKDEYWKKISYTSVSKEHEYQAKPNQNKIPEKTYDEFTYKILPKGNRTGNLLHEILENISFNSPDGWESVISKTIRKHFPKKEEVWTEHIKQLLDETLNNEILIDGHKILLSEVCDEKKINELEFDINFDDFATEYIKEISSDERLIAVKNLGKSNGWLNGKIDLFFEEKGKYYILDWKSNFLGDNEEHYTVSNVRAAMNENNYHLQYLIYCVAAKKYLTNRIKGFSFEKQFGGVIYLFLRGIRKGKNNGIFTTDNLLKEVLVMESFLGINKQ